MSVGGTGTPASGTVALEGSSAAGEAATDGIGACCASAAGGVVVEVVDSGTVVAVVDVVAVVEGTADVNELGSLSDLPAVATVLLPDGSEPEAVIAAVSATTATAAIHTRSARIGRRCGMRPKCPVPAESAQWLIRTSRPAT
jgi:hypothetical protein